jgi:hypothetical protein
MFIETIFNPLKSHQRLILIKHAKLNNMCDLAQSALTFSRLSLVFYMVLNMYLHAVIKNI